MLIFILYTILFWFAGACFCKYFYASTQPEQVLDVVFKWQRMLAHLYGKDGYARLLAKALGDCEMCFASATGIVWFAIYCLFMNIALDVWISCNWGANIAWYFVYTSIQWMLNRWFITGKFL